MSMVTDWKDFLLALFLFSSCTLSYTQNSEFSLGYYGEGSDIGTICGKIHSAQTYLSHEIMKEIFLSKKVLFLIEKGYISYSQEPKKFIKQFFGMPNIKQSPQQWIYAKQVNTKNKIYVTVMIIDFPPGAQAYLSCKVNTLLNETIQSPDPIGEDPVSEKFDTFGSIFERYIKIKLASIPRINV